MGGNSYSLNAVPLKCTTTAETLVMHCTINLSLSLVCSLPAYLCSDYREDCTPNFKNHSTARDGRVDEG